jgi:hypothetical protein
MLMSIMLMEGRKSSLLPLRAATSATRALVLAASMEEVKEEVKEEVNEVVWGRRASLIPGHWRIIGMEGITGTGLRRSQQITAQPPAPPTSPCRDSK